MFPHNPCALEMLIQFSKGLLRIGSEDELLQHVCETAVDAGKYSASSVLYVEDIHSNTFTAACHYSHLRPDLSPWFLADSEICAGDGPAARAVLAGKMYIADNITGDITDKPWLKQASSKGLKSLIAVPLRQGDQTFGALCLYNSEPHPVSTQESVLLEHIAETLSSAIITFCPNICTALGEHLTSIDAAPNRAKSPKHNNRRSAPYRSPQTIAAEASKIAHDFNNLLTVILGCADILVEETAQQPALNKYACGLKVAADRGALLTRELLELARNHLNAISHDSVLN